MKLPLITKNEKGEVFHVLCIHEGGIVSGVNGRTLKMEVVYMSTLTVLSEIEYNEYKERNKQKSNNPSVDYIVQAVATRPIAKGEKVTTDDIRVDILDKVQEDPNVHLYNKIAGMDAGIGYQVHDTALKDHKIAQLATLLAQAIDALLQDTIS